jgi:hypothetical protein
MTYRFLTLIVLASSFCANAQELATKIISSQVVSETALQVDGVLVVGEDRFSPAPFLVNNVRPTIGLSDNTSIASFARDYLGNRVSFHIFGYPDIDLVHSHVRNSVMLYGASDVKDVILCATQSSGAIRFVTDNWIDAAHERARINNTGLGIGTTDPKEKLHVKDGDIYIENLDRGVVMKSPNGACWRLTVTDEGTPGFTSVPCP